MNAPLLTRPQRGGHLVAVIGLDGAGKSSQVKALGQWMKRHGVRGHAYQSVTMAPVRKALNAIASEQGFQDHLDFIGGETMRLISACAQLARVSAIGSSIQEGELAVVDRYTYCQFALASAENVGDVRFLRSLCRAAPQPDLTIFLDISPDEAVRRINLRGVDQESVEFLKKFRRAYVDLPEFNTFVSVDGDQDFDAVQLSLRQTIRDAFPKIDFEGQDSAANSYPASSPSMKP